MAGTDTTSPLVLCDAGPLIHLDEMGCSDLLSDFAEILIPEAVLLEVQRHRPGALAAAGFSFRRIAPNTEVPAALKAIAKVFTLHTGEWDALRVALDHAHGILLSDDTAARLAAGNLGIQTHGTIGIIVRAIRRKLRTEEEVLTLLRTLPERSTLHLKRSLLDQVISEIEKAFEK